VGNQLRVSSLAGGQVGGRRPDGAPAGSSARAWVWLGAVPRAAFASARRDGRRCLPRGEAAGRQKSTRLHLECLQEGRSGSLRLQLRLRRDCSVRYIRVTFFDWGVGLETERTRELIAGYPRYGGRQVKTRSHKPGLNSANPFAVLKHKGLSFSSVPYSGFRRV